MTTDRELLELAAKAAGIKLAFNGYGKVPEEGSVARFIGEEIYFFSTRRGEGNVLWNPLTEDGAALRLAVKCHIDIRHFMYEQGRMDCLVDRLGRGFCESFTDDPCAATRRAIVRAAAEIGKAMP